jgi:hypothetical protein
MSERLIPKLDRLGAEAGIKQMTPEMYRFAWLLNEDKNKTFDEWVKKRMEEQRPWVGLTDEEAQLIYDMGRTPTGMMEMVEAKLKEKNT